MDVIANNRVKQTRIKIISDLGLKSRHVKWKEIHDNQHLKSSFYVLPNRRPFISFTLKSFKTDYYIYIWKNEELQTILKPYIFHEQSQLNFILHFLVL